MTDVTEWLKEHRHINEKGIDSAARALWDNDDPEGESPNESFEDEPRWSQERYKQAAQAAICTYYDATGFASLLTAMKKVLELHAPVTSDVDSDRPHCHLCGHWPCDTYAAIEGVINE
ncbi:hypothetical protein [Brevibacterium zhoupengii]|uniref:hypothetical protein n=1 Tax=Brevibacterium zhoupengii TaxID=2898795 RepID=UPI001F094BBB|nr:hypothetical protein [Brevibacterium zhoupengii]